MTLPHHILLFSSFEMITFNAAIAIKKMNQVVAELANQGDAAEPSASEFVPVFNDMSTADTIIKLKPSNQLLYAHSTILSKSPFFEACKNFKESNGYIEITPPCISTAAECIEFLYLDSLEGNTSDLSDLIVLHIRSKFFADVFRNAVYLQIDGIIKICYEKHPLLT